MVCAVHPPSLCLCLSVHEADSPTRQAAVLRHSDPGGGGSVGVCRQSSPAQPVCVLYCAVYKE